MNTFGVIEPNNYQIENFYANSPISWQLVSSSVGVQVDVPEDLVGSITITRATNDPFYLARDIDAYSGLPISPYNIETGVPEHVLYRSIKHLFYDNNFSFASASRYVTESIAGLPDAVYVVSVGQQFYGEQIRPYSFDLKLDSDPEIIKDDGFGNLFISQSNVGYYVGNIFYESGIAVIRHNTSSLSSGINNLGMKILNGTRIYLNYNSDVRITRHQINVILDPSEFNFSVFNPTSWDKHEMMNIGTLKPYVTTIGLYNDANELLAVAKLSTPIQRTFDVNQIFIVRFDT